MFNHLTLDTHALLLVGFKFSIQPIEFRLVGCIGMAETEPMRLVAHKLKLEPEFYQHPCLAWGIRSRQAAIFPSSSWRSKKTEYLGPNNNLLSSLFM